MNRCTEKKTFVTQPRLTKLNEHMVKVVTRSKRVKYTYQKLMSKGDLQKEL